MICYLQIGGEYVETRVVYGNDLNKVQFKGFTGTDYNLLMVTCLLAKDKGTERQEISYSELKDLAKLGNSTIKEIDTQLKEMANKLSKAQIIIEDDEEWAIFNLFQTFRGNKQNKTLTFQVSEDWSSVLNKLSSQFTYVELANFIKIKGKYAKTLYRLLCQYRHTGWLEIEVDEFRSILDVPSKYQNKLLMRDVIKPAIKELQNYIENLTVKALYDNKIGKPLKGYRFCFEKVKKCEKKETTAISQNEKTQSDLKPKQKKSKKATNQFNNFTQREYSKEQIATMEKQLLQKSMNTSRELTEKEKEDYMALTKGCHQSSINDYIEEKK